jgi:hypothetical protein
MLSGGGASSVLSLISHLRDTHTHTHAHTQHTHTHTHTHTRGTPRLRVVPVHSERALSSGPFCRIILAVQ